jgi:GNAT superfamily N-acetyltransferase
MALTIRELHNTAQLIQDNEALGREHYDEIALNKRLMEYAPDIERYAALEEQGILACVGVFDGDEMVGYSVNLVVHHLHYKHLVTAHNDMIFIAKSHRKGRTGLLLIKATKELCGERGAKIMMWHAKEGSALAKLLPRLGCRVQDIIFSEDL